jgi:filamentous hemagglutinin family protein
VQHRQRALFVINLSLASLGFLTLANTARAQVVPDNTLGAESSVVTPDVEINGIPSDRIDGGATRGANLFHSFEEFNVGEGRGAYFSNPAAIENILSRVTGSNPSNILGTLGVLGNANLFLLNPNGIVFGPNARLDVRGSFLGSTADSLVFGNGFEFSATNPQAPPLLTVNIPIGLRFRENPGNITNQSAALNFATFTPDGLQVPPGETLALIGGDVSFDGGKITAPGARVELGGLSAAGEVNFNDDGSLSFPENVERSDLYLSNSAEVNVRAGGGGNITIDAQNVELLEGSKLLAGIDERLGSPNAQAGNIEINATETIQIANESAISNRVLFSGVGNGGNIFLTTNILEGRNGAVIDASTFGQGNAGKILIRVADEFTLVGSGILSNVGSEAIGNVGEIRIDAGSVTFTDETQLQAGFFSGGQGNRGIISVQATDSVSLENTQFFANVESGAVGDSSNIQISGQSVFLNGSLLKARNEGQGNAGNISVTADSVTLLNGSSIDSSNIFGTGNAGTVEINAKNGVSFSGDSYIFASSVGTGNGGNVTVRAGGAVSLANSDISSTASLGTASRGGDISITARSLSLTDNSDLGAFGAEEGGAGNITVRTTDFVSLDNDSSLSVFASGTGAGGNIEIETGKLSVRNGSSFLASLVSLSDSVVVGDQSAGKLTVNASDSVEVSGGSSLSVDTTGDGNAGNITINTKKLTVRDGARISSSALGGKGSAGTILINASESVELTGTTPDGLSSSQITTDTGEEGNAGNIQITTGRLVIQDGSRISSLTSLDSSGEGGNLEVNASESVEVSGVRLLGGFNPTSLDTSTAGTGDAGDINITTNRLIVRDGAAITSATTNDGQAGNVEINALESVEVSGTSTLFLLPSKITTQNLPLFGAEGFQGAGNILINTPQLTLSDRGQITATTSGIGDAGDILVRDANIVSLTGGAQILSQTTAEGNAGNLEIDASNRVTISGSGTGLLAQTEGSGNAGSITLDTPQLIIENGGQILAFTAGSGDGGNITVTAPTSITVDNNSQLSVETRSAGKAGDIFITTDTLTLGKDAQLSASATATSSNSEGGGSMILNATNLNISGKLGIFAETQSVAPAGNLTLQPDNNKPNLDILFTDNGFISASTSGSGRGGNINITASENIQIAGEGKIAVETSSVGNAGSINITSQNLNISQGTQITASTTGEGAAGNIILNADSLTATEGGTIQTNTASSGNAGDITLNIRDSLNLTASAIEASTAPESTGDGGNIIIDPIQVTLTEGANISVNSQGQGNGGSLFLSAENLTLDNGSAISAATASGEGGNITLQISELLRLRQNSPISATAGGTGNGGNITINTDFLVASDKSDITANAFQGRGGNISIAAQGIFLSPDSNITASSELGIEGVVEIDTPENDPSRGLVELPETFVDPRQLIAQNACRQGAKSEFLITGRGGLPSSPEQVQHSDEVEVGLVEPAVDAAVPVTPPPVAAVIEEIVPARGWIRNDKGEVVLVGYDPTASGVQRQERNLGTCPPR